MTLDGTPYYLADGGPKRAIDDVNKLFNTGSYYYKAGNWWTLFTAERGAGNDDTYKPNVAF